MKCHCNEAEELRVANDTLAELLRGATGDRTRWEEKALSTFDRLTEANARAQVAEHKLERIEALTTAWKARYRKAVDLGTTGRERVIAATLEMTAYEVEQVLDA